MGFILTLEAAEKVNSDIINQLRDNQTHRVKLSTTRKEIEYDRKDARAISRLKNVKIVYEMPNEGILILIGSLGCRFHSPFGGEFFCARIVKETTDFKDVKGVDADVCFTPNLATTRIEEMQSLLALLVNDKKFEYNIGQFDEFMEIFEYYRKLSDELNNNISYEIEATSKPYYFLGADVKGFNPEFATEIKDVNGVLKGYKFSETELFGLPTDVKDQVRELIDIRIKGNNEAIQRIRRVGDDNIYLSNTKFVTERDVRNLNQFVVFNTAIQKDEVVLSGELKNSAMYEEEFDYLNLYDMGQKIKVDSIDNSLRLINQGATSAAAELLEYLIGDKKMPNKASGRKLTAAKEKYIEGLNESQKEAFLMAVDGSPVSLIKGPPGTGKTHVINAIVQYITKELGEKVVISSQTHIAIDNVLDKLVENYDLVIPNRITNRRNKYSGNEIDETLFRTWGRKFLDHNERATDKKLSKAIADQMAMFAGEQRFKYAEENNSEDFSVIGATTTTSAIAGKKGLEVLKGYDWLIIDEVSKCPITEVLRYLPYVSKVILVGDDFQLAPLLEFSKEEVKGLPSYDEDMFDKLETIYEQSVFAKVLDKAVKSDRLVLLKENYRSVRQVLDTYNFFYDNALIGKREEIRPNKVQFDTDDCFINYQDSDVFFVEVLNGQETKDGTSRFNVEEIQATADLLKNLMKHVKNPQSVTVSAIFPYAAQIAHFQKNNLKLINEAKKFFKSFEIDTVDAFQGKETDIVLVNTVVTDASQRNFLNDFRRINVSMSRARDKLIVFGNSIVLSKIRMKILGGQERHYFKEIIDYISAKGRKIVYKGGEFSHGNTRKNTINIA